MYSINYNTLSVSENKVLRRIFGPGRGEKYLEPGNDNKNQN
jgi:hypothetical protein